MKALIALPDRHSRPSPVRRAAFVRMIAAANLPAYGGDVREIAGRLYPAGKALPDFVTRAPTSPADSTAFDGATPAENVGLQFLRSLAPGSAAARLIARAAGNFSVDAARGVTLPTRANGPIPMPWTVEAGAIPMTGDGLSGVQFPAPKKVGIIFAVNRELMKRPMAEAAIGLLLNEAGSRALDSAIFSDQDADAAGLAGLLYDAVDASDGIAASDPARVLAQLARVVSTGGGGDTIFVTDPATAAALRVLVPDMRDDVFPSGAIELWLNLGDAA